MRVALVQLAATDDEATNLACLLAQVERAAHAGASLVVAPEAAMLDFGRPGQPLAGQPLDGPFVSGVAGVAARHGVTVVAGMFESAGDETDKVFNTVVVLGPTGELLDTYRKQHLFDALGWNESATLEAGPATSPLVVEVGELTLGVLTCYDLRFPELARAAIDAGATCLAVPAAWAPGPGKEHQWRTLVTARAIENVCYVAAAGQAPPRYAGSSLLVDPFGVTVAAAGESSGVVVGDVSAERVEECRRRMPSLEHRRWAVVPRPD
jgi:predicted amidohydrolase